jgi:hypothetical protein
VLAEPTGEKTQESPCWVQKVQYLYSAALAFPATDSENMSIAAKAIANLLMFRISDRGAIDMFELLPHAVRQGCDEIHSTKLLWI